MLRWQDLVERSNDGLAGLDTVEVNLAVAAGLPGAERMNVARCRRFADDAARRAELETLRLRPQFHRDPGYFHNSEAFFRCMVLTTVLQRDLGIRYAEALMDRDDYFADSRPTFLHGVIQSGVGTCCSLPVLYLAVGRRLGYPLKLVSAKQHLFCRWDEPGGERFNVECTSVGMNSYPDDYYLTWPLPATPHEVKEFCYLRSMTPRQELSNFLWNRGCCGVENRRYNDAVESFAWAAELDPDNAHCKGNLCYAMDRWRERLMEVWPAGFPTMDIYFPPRQFKVMPLDLERAILHLEVMDSLLLDPHFQGRWWTPLREGRRPADVPAHVTVRYKDRLNGHVQFHKVAPHPFTDYTD